MQVQSSQQPATERPLVDDPKMWRVSADEMNRRWALVRAHLVERGLDALIVQGYEDKAGGVVKWFTDIPAGYARTVIFHRDDLMTLVDHGPNGEHRILAGKDPVQSGVGDVVSNWSFQAAHYTSHLNARDVLGVVKRRGYKRVGIAGRTGMPYGFVSTLLEGLGGLADVSDESEFMDLAKACKSDEEISLIRRAARVQDEVFKLVLGHVKPGMRDFEVNAFVDYQLQLRGSERGVFIAKSAPMRKPGGFGYRHLQGRTLREGDAICVLLESNSLGGLWTEMARTICLGKAAPELVDAFDAAKAAQHETARLCVPGAAPADIWARFNAFRTSQGGTPERRLHSHGQGYDSVERPLVREDESMLLHAGMNLAIHPTHATPNAFGHVCDNWLVDADGKGSFIHSTAQRLFEI